MQKPAKSLDHLFEYDNIRIHRRFTIADKKVTPWDREFLEQASEVFKALGHPIRMLILRMLSQDPSNVSGLVTSLNIPQALVSQHLRILFTQKLISKERKGNQVIYTLAKQEVKTIFKCLEHCFLSSKEEPTLNI